MDAPNKSLRAVELLSRVLISAIFFRAGVDKLLHREGNRQYMGSKNVPTSMIPALLSGAVLAELGGASALVLGMRPRWVAPMLAAYLIPTSLIFHDFWNEQGRER